MVWVAHLAPDHAAEREAWSLLSVGERARAGSFNRTEDRALVVRTRALLRQVLADYTGCDARELAIGAGLHGKPEVLGPDRAGWPHFNVSHSGSVALIGVARRHQIGVDVEQVRVDMPWREVARAFFSPGEIKAIERRPPNERHLAFFECWVRKEAYLKGLGTGLRRATDDFEAPLGDRGGLVHDEAHPADGTAGAAWHVHPIEAGGGYAAAAAVDGDVPLTVRRLGSPSG